MNNRWKPDHKTEGKLGQVVGADREAIEDFTELICQDDIIGNLTHFIYFQQE